MGKGGSHAKEYAVYFNDGNGNKNKYFSVVKTRQVYAEDHGKRYGLIHGSDYSHVVQIKKFSKT